MRRFEWTLFIAALALFSYSMLDILALAPWERSVRPRQSMLLSGAILLQATAGLVQPRAMWASLVLLALSVIALFGSIATTG